MTSASADARRPVRAVLLDADGTLWDTSAAMDAAGAVAMRVVWPDLGDETARVAAVRFRSDPTAVFRAFVGGHHTFEEMRSLRLRDVAQTFGLPWEDAHSMRFETAYLPLFDEALRAFEDSLPFLEWLADERIPVRVLTNSAQAFTVAKVASAGLATLGGLVCSRDCLGVGKPSPEVFHHACEELGFEPAEVAYVGDEWTSDVMGSCDAGLMAVWLRRGDEAAGEELTTVERLGVAAERGIPVIASLAELPQLLRPAV